MHLKHLLQSIVQEADQRIADENKSHADRMDGLKAAHEKKLESIRKNAQDRLNERKRSLREKAESFGRITSSKLLLKTKNAEIDAVYDAVLTELKSLSGEDLKKFFKACLAQMGDETGTIRAAPQHESVAKEVAGSAFKMGDALPKSSGGFMVSTPKREWNFTFDFLVHQALRPATEISTAAELFA